MSEDRFTDLIQKKRPRPAVLLVLDGFGVAPDADGNAVTRANLANFTEYTKKYPVVNLKASGEAVGLMWGEMGNSEVGHLTIGAGRVFYQTLPRIETSIESGSFMENPNLIKIADFLKNSKGKLHIMGIMSSGKVHGYNKHAYALLDFAKKHKIKNTFVHAIMDGRDTLYNSGLGFIEELQGYMKKHRIGDLATISGRYYAMDRDNRWDRTEKAYRAIALGESESMTDDINGFIEESYAREVFDEQIPPTVITKHGEPLAKVEPGDAVIFFNFRPDRARQITKAFVLPEFQKFKREFIHNLHFTTMAQYEDGLPVDVVFPDEDLKNTLAEVLSNNDLVQLHIAETEKYAHVTFFMNGKRENPFPHEDRIIIPSPSIESYDLEPRMSAQKITDKIVEEVKKDNYDFIIANFANPDMVAHTGNYEATIEANEFIDTCVGNIVSEVLKKDGIVFITADHGNAEEVKNLQTADVDKEHSTNPVPFFIIANNLEGRHGLSGPVPNNDLSLLPTIGMLADVAPTIIEALGLPKPPEMTGTSLYNFE